MKNLVYIVCFLVVAVSYAQDPMLQRDDQALEKEAFAITKDYNKELALDGEQVTLFQKKVEEFLIRREDIKERYSGKRELDALMNLQSQETIEMMNILTQPQMDLYRKIKPRLQPLAEVEE